MRLLTNRSPTLEKFCLEIFYWGNKNCEGIW
jgi:hypothetical protein